MWRIRSLFVLAVLAVVVLVGTVVVQADWGWWWNAQLDVEGVEVHTAWTVEDDADGSNYRAQIKFWAPQGADVVVVDESDNESVVTPEAGVGLACTADGVEAKVEYLVLATSGSATGQDASVWVTVVGVPEPIGEGSGQVGDRITVDVVIPVANPTC